MKCGPSGPIETPARPHLSLRQARSGVEIAPNGRPATRGGPRPGAFSSRLHSRELFQTGTGGAVPCRQRFALASTKSLQGLVRFPGDLGQRTAEVSWSGVRDRSFEMSIPQRPRRPKINLRPLISLYVTWPHLPEKRNVCHNSIRQHGIRKCEGPAAVAKTCNIL